MTQMQIAWKDPFSESDIAKIKTEHEKGFPTLKEALLAAKEQANNRINKGE